MKRREVITLLGGAAAAWPLVAARAEQPIPVVGFLSGGSPETMIDQLSGFRDGLRSAGYVEGRNVVIEYRWNQGHNDRLPALAADLVHRQVSIIAAGGTPAALAAKAATSTIPIAFYTAADPVEIGLVASLNQPGGNLTGVTSLSGELAAKRLEILHELLPTATIVAALLNPTSSALAKTLSRNLQAAARALGLQLQLLYGSTENDIEMAIATLGQLHVGGLVIGTDAFFTSRSEHLAALTLRHGIPSIYQYRPFAVAGGFMSYGGDISEAYRLTGVYSGRLLRGEKPTGLPVQQSTKADLIVNLKTAKALGISVPLPLLARADEVIE
jgi:putative ABC transport system substrate-binding protein